MNKKFIITAFVVAVVLAGIVAIYLHLPAQTRDAYEILLSSKRAVENLDSMKADAYFFNSLHTPSLNEDSNYTMRIELLRTAGEGAGECTTMKMNFKDYEYVCSDDRREVAHERLRQSLRNAWILDTHDKVYLYSPVVLNDSVTEFTPRHSLMRYVFIPVIDPLHHALLFDRAENASYEGIQTINVGNIPVEAYVISYKFSYPLITFAREARLKTWISTYDYIPLKTEAHAIHETENGTTEMDFEFGFESYEKGVSIPTPNLSLPEDMNIVKRV
ncbi:MAG: hypothetical protein ACXQTW_08680 [Candidatus Methanospirareceae archaeon]